MLLFGYIISETNYVDLPDDIIKVVKKEEECELALPKLVIGLESSKKYAEKHNMKFDILNHTFPNGDMWTFKKTEKREYYEKDIESFKKHIIRNITKNIIYYYINIFKLRYNDIKRLYNIIINNKLNRDINYILIDNDMLYYSLDNNKVIGISLACFRYLNIDRDKVLSIIKSNNKNYIYYSSSKKMWRLKEWFSGYEYVIPSILTNNLAK